MIKKAILLSFLTSTSFAYSTDFGAIIAAGEGLSGPSSASSVKTKCNGCYHGYCWSYCYNFFSPTAWCYGSKSQYTQSREYVKCEKDEDCGESDCTTCGGPCSD